MALNSALAAASRVWPTKIISCSQRAIQVHARRGYPVKKMQWIGNGLDTERFKPNASARAELRTSLGIPAAAPVIGFVGRNVPVKDLPTFFRAAAIYLEHDPNAHFICCGADLSAPAGFPKPAHLHFIPFRQDMENVYPAFDVMGMTSRSEAFPMVLIEAMACGVPCTATDVGDAGLIIGHSAYIAPVGDAARIAKTWQTRLAQPSDANSERASIVSRFSLPATVAKYAAVYQSILSPLPTV
jgi:glycosyltransferase involved in cell wall biosynthesis